MTAAPIACAVALDWVFGDPQVRWHPVRLVGLAAESAERLLRKYGMEGRPGGGIFLASILAVCGLPVFLLVSLIDSAVLKFAAESLIIYFSISLRSLFDAAGRVHTELAAGNIESARRSVSEICGRDTGGQGSPAPNASVSENSTREFSPLRIGGGLDEAALTRATVESVAENSVDGFTAPIFFAALFGPAGAWFYRIVNTLDSMVGYKNEKYLRFGWASARLDDLLNLIPARITAVLISLWAPSAGGRIGESFVTLARFGCLHPSPNAGWSESAAAGALGIRLGGPSFYGGREVSKPWLGTGVRVPAPEDIRRAMRLSAGASLSFAILFLAISSCI
ncbi:cobalamin biosynthesis protein [bacterium]|nr:cobalamin biosynthesis protein [bacterium]